MNMIFKYRTLLFLFIPFLLNSQYAQQKKADAQFNKFAFIKASKNYEEVLTHNFNTDYVHRKLADCYFMLRNPEKAAPHFKKVVQQPDIPNAYYYNYAIVLRSLGDYNEAEKWLEKFKEEGGKKKLVKHIDENPDALENKPTYELKDVNFNTKNSDFGAYQFGDRVYFVSAKKESGPEQRIYSWNEQPFLDLYTFNLSDSIPAIEPLSGAINTKFHEGPISISEDGKALYFSRNNYLNKQNEKDKKGINHLQIYKATNVGGKWENIVPLPFNNKSYSTSHPALSPDGKTLYFASDMPEGYGKTDIYKVTINNNGTYGKPENLGPIINTAGEELFPFVNSESTLFFSSDGHEGLGLLDIYATITSEENKISSIVNMGAPINSKKDDFSFFMNTDGLSGYIASNRNNAATNDDIYAFETVLPLLLKGVVTDSINSKPIANARIELFDENHQEIITLSTNNNGYYETFIEREKDYSIKGSREKYMDKSKVFSSKNIGKKLKELVVNLELSPVDDLSVLADLNTIFFDFDKYNIRPDAAKELDKIVRLLTEEYPDMVMEIESHTDSRGSLSYNDRLSIDRANATYDYLVSQGLNATRVIAHEGYGERRLTNGCSDGVKCEEPEHQENRRTEFKILKMK
ncbi:OmpA family protein [Galbibacter mesophilus]|uniref:OmpA family protein n=1 Tax=Galbibacter mesophilus TaxID=379069 RepID=UPI00191ECC2D|nr:OmpA family protein [Galbibacter mesophilus]MCM5663034.1 OmpA family protein [Galbibacter mesophilus]